MSFTPDFPSWLPVGPSPNCFKGRKPGIPVSGLIIHFTAAGSGKGSADYFAKSEVSWTENGVVKTAKVQAAAQLVIDRDGTVYQCTPLEDRAWHAGPSTLWKGQPLKPGQNVNDWTIGIEIANWGQLKAGPGGSYVNYLGKPFTGQVYVHQDGTQPPTYWEAFPETQVQAVIQAAKVLTHKYPAITRDNVLGHRDVDPARKVDPGPAWPMKRFLDAVYGSADDDDHVVALNAAEDDDRRGHYDEAAEMCLVDPKPA
jgi:N-acetylmuramoyl-L-alanine amidase